MSILSPPVKFHTPRKGALIWVEVFIKRRDDEGDFILVQESGHGMELLKLQVPAEGGAAESLLAMLSAGGLIWETNPDSWILRGPFIHESLSWFSLEIVGHLSPPAEAVSLQGTVWLPKQDWCSRLRSSC